MNVMRENDWIDLKEAAKALGIGESTLRKGLLSGKYSGRQVAWGSRQKWQVRLSGFSENKKLEKNSSELIQKWESEQLNGFHTGRAISPRRVKENTYGLRVFWQYHTKAKEIKGIKPEDINPLEITAENLKQALANVPIDHQARQDHHASRVNMFLACCSFGALLVRENILTHEQLAAIKAQKPKRRIFPARKTVLRDNQLQDLIRLNDRRVKGRTEYDRELTKTILMLCVYAGLRRNEVRLLEVGDIDLKNKEIHILDGKGHKARYVGIVPPLLDQLKVWLAIRKKPVNPSRCLLIQAHGLPITNEVINGRIQSLAKLAGVDITPHGLRRTFATIMEDYGMPWSYIKESLGHEKITTTQGYILTDKKRAADWLKNWGSDGPKAEKKERLNVSDLLRMAKK